MFCRWRRNKNGKSYVNNLGITKKGDFTDHMNRYCPVLVGLTVLISACTCLKPSLRFEGDIVVMDSTQGEIIVKTENGEPLIGNTIFTKDQVHFIPKFPFMTGQTYEASFTDSNGRRTTTSHTFKVKASNPSLISLSPSGHTVPANHLKFYLQPLFVKTIVVYLIIMDFVRANRIILSRVIF